MRGSECNGNTVETQKACEKRKQQKRAVKWGSLETENIWPSYASYFACPCLASLVLIEILVSGSPLSWRQGQETRVASWLNAEQWRGRSGDSACFPLWAKFRQKDSPWCQTVTAELELSPLSLHSLPFQRADVSPPRPRDSAAKTAHLLSIWPSSISGLATRDTMINILPPALSFLIVPRALSIFHRRDGGRGQIDESRHQSIRDPTHLSS